MPFYIPVSRIIVLGGPLLNMLFFVFFKEMVIGKHWIVEAPYIGDGRICCLVVLLVMVHVDVHVFFFNNFTAASKVLLRSMPLILLFLRFNVKIFVNVFTFSVLIFNCFLHTFSLQV